MSLIEGLRVSWQTLADDRPFMLLQMGFMLCGAAFFMTGHVHVMLCRDRLGFSPGDLALWLAVVPQIMLAVSSLGWGRILDRAGMVRSRLLIAAFMTGYFVCFFLGISLDAVWFIYLGSALRGICEGGGQVTWSTSSVQFAPRDEDVPTYNGIHFILNGIRGLTMPGVGSLLALFSGPGTILVAALLGVASVVVAQRAIKFGNGPDHVVEPIETADAVCA